MGGKQSKPELTRKKSFTAIGRSSQRLLFDKQRKKLDRINRALDDKKEISPEAPDKIRADLDTVETQLETVTETVKARNQKKYEEVRKYLQETRDKLDRAFPATEEDPATPEGSLPKIEEVEENTEGSPRSSVQLRKPIGPSEDIQVVEDTEEESDEEEQVELRSKDEKLPKQNSVIKFGVQVMPLIPRISQELLKRRTVPTNSAPKAEFEKLRNVSAGGFTSFIKPAEPDPVGSTRPSSNFSQNGGVFRNSSQSDSPKEKVDRISFTTWKPPTIQEQVEGIVREIDRLEEELKFFNGRKRDRAYAELHDGFVKYLIKLDNIEVGDNPVLRQEKRIIVQRIQELERILERLVVQNELLARENETREESKTGTDRKESITVEGRMIPATAL